MSNAQNSNSASTLAALMSNKLNSNYKLSMPILMGLHSRTITPIAETEADYSDSIGSVGYYCGRTWMNEDEIDTSRLIIPWREIPNKGNITALICCSMDLYINPSIPGTRYMRVGIKTSGGIAYQYAGTAEITENVGNRGTMNFIAPIDTTTLESYSDDTSDYIVFCMEHQLKQADEIRNCSLSVIVFDSQ